MKRKGRLQRFLGRFTKGSRRTERGVRLRPAVLRLEDRCLPAYSFPSSPYPIGQMVGGQFGDVWYERTSGSIGHLAADGTVTELGGSGSQDIETDAYGNLWTVNTSDGITLIRYTPDGSVSTVSNPDQELSVNALQMPPDSFLPRLLFDANGNADIVVVDQAGDASLVAAPMSTDTSALRAAWGALPVVAKTEGALGEQTALWYPDGSGFNRLDYSGNDQYFPLPAGDTNVVATLGLGPDQNLWFVEAAQDNSSSTGAFYATNIGERYSSGNIVEANIGSQSDRLKVSDFVTSSDGSSLWFDQVGYQSDWVNVQSGTHRIGQVNFDKSVSYYSVPDLGEGQTVAIGPDGSMWTSTSTYDGQYETDIEQTAISGLYPSGGMNLSHSSPQAGNLSVSTNQDTTITGNLPVESNGYTLQYSVQSIPDDGTVVVNNNGTFTYTPNAGYIGVDSFNYTVDDGQGGMAVGTVTVTVNTVNQAPFAADATELVSGSNPVSAVLPVSDLDGNPLQYTIISGPAQGTVAITTGQGAPGALGDIWFTYTPNSPLTGSDSFAYQVSDGPKGTATGTITFTAYSTAPPTAQNGTVSTYVDSAATGRLPAFDDNGVFLTPSIISSPTNGYVTLPDAGRPGNYGDTTFMYYPNPGFVGTDSFVYQVDDGQGGTATATMTVTVAPLFGTAAVYADTHWANMTYGTTIATPDPLNANAAPAIVGYNAFPFIGNAISAASAIFAPNPSSGKVVVNGANGDTGSGIFGEPVVDDSSVPVYAQQGPVTVNSLTGNNLANISLHGVNVNLNVGDSNNTTYAGTLTGSGGLTKVGAGTLTLSGTNTYSGGTAIQDGVLQVSSDSNLGIGSVTGGSALATLSFTGTTATTKSFAMNGGQISVAANQTVTFGGGVTSPVSGTYLSGSGTFATNSTAGQKFIGVTNSGSTTLVSASPADQFVNFTNNGGLTIAAEVNATGMSGTVNLNNFTNQGSGTVTVGADAQINVSNFQSYGTTFLSPGTTGMTKLTNVGTSSLYFNGGSRTAIGSFTAASSRADLELNGQNAIVAGGLLVNNALVTDNSVLGVSTIIADYGALVKGAGAYDNSVMTRNGGRFQAGNCPGSSTFEDFAFGPTAVSNYLFEIDDANGAAGPNPDANNHLDGWSLVNTGNFAFNATAANPLTVNLATLLNPSLAGTDIGGAMDNFDPTQSYSWAAVHFSGTYTGPTDDAALNASTVFNTSAFINAYNGKFAWHLDTSTGTLYLTYTPA